MSTSTTGRTIEILNSLLRGELSAIETYSKAIHKFPEAGAVQTLERIRTDHLHSVSILRDLIHRDGGHPSTDSGTWGAFAKTVESTASLLGPNSAIAALRQGEKHGIGEYEDALKDSELPGDIKQTLRRLYEPLQRHLRYLEDAQD
ncbi:MAG: DUF2383 domain-containing protein [Verrucomicrobiaceae bacterium]|nr:MAG: DUF2383 domain-containing protein [Verrucomicrobiaceae bacterium]